MSNLQLTDDQQAAYEAFVSFVTGPDHSFVLKGYAGTGKTTLVKHLLKQLPEINKTIKLLKPDMQDMDVLLTATTHKAAEALSDAINMDVSTIHSKLQLKVEYDAKTRTNKLVPRGATQFQLTDSLIFIDEASYIGHKLLSWIKKRTLRCKIVYIGDPAQLLDVGCSYSPVFSAGLPETKLTKIVRQAEGSPIIDLSTKFREVLDTGQFFQFKPDGQAIKHLPRDQFDAAIQKEFTRPGWHHNDSKILVWTNKASIAYNQKINQSAKGRTEFQVGDYAIVNGFVNTPQGSLKNEQVVHITACRKTFLHSIPGYEMTVNNSIRIFTAQEWYNETKIIKHLQQEYPTLSEDEITTIFVSDFLSTFADLRSAYSCTINKSQGSTYGKVFIDLDDLRRCNIGSQIARLLYVAVSRAKDQVIFTGDLV